MAPPSTRSCTADIIAVDAASRSTMVPASGASIPSTNIVREAKRGGSAPLHRPCTVSGYGMGRRKSAIGAAQRSERLDSHASPASPPSAWTIIARRRSVRSRSSGGRNGIGGATITVAIEESASGAASASAMNAEMTSGVAAQEEHPAHHRVDGMQAEAEARSHTEVATAAADRPEQSPARSRRSRRRAPLPLSGHDIRRQQVVDREAVLPNEEPDPAAEGDPRRSPPCRRLRTPVGELRGRQWPRCTPVR